MNGKILCKLFGHDWEIVKRIPAPEGMERGVPVERIRCRRCGKAAFRAVGLKPDDTIYLPWQTRSK